LNVLSVELNVRLNKFDSKKCVINNHGMTYELLGLNSSFKEPNTIIVSQIFIEAVVRRDKGCQSTISIYIYRIICFDCIFIGLSTESITQYQEIEKWTRNLTSFQQSFKKRSQDFKSMAHSLESLCKMPNEAKVIGRYLALAEGEKSRSNRIATICEEITKLWFKFSFPILSRSVVKQKVSIIIQKYDKYLKRPCAGTKYSFINLIDVTKCDAYG
jgi:hypothetical protein